MYLVVSFATPQTQTLLYLTWQVEYNVQTVRVPDEVEMHTITQSFFMLAM